METVIENMAGLLELHECESLEEFSDQFYENTESDLDIGFIGGYSDHIEDTKEVIAIYFYNRESELSTLLQFPFTLDKFNDALKK